MGEKAGKVIRYVVFSEDYYPSLEDLIAEIVARCQMSAIYITSRNVAYMIDDVMPNIPVLDYRKPVYALRPGHDVREIPSNVYVMVRAFEYPKESELFRLITCLYESVDDAINDRNAIRLVVYRDFLKHHVREEIIANLKSNVEHYPWSLLPISHWQDYMITYSEKVGNTVAFRRIVAELHRALALNKYLR